MSAASRERPEFCIDERIFPGRSRPSSLPARLKGQAGRHRLFRALGLDWGGSSPTFASSSQRCLMSLTALRLCHSLFLNPSVCACAGDVLEGE
jgi:hypothetical protein